VFGYARPSDYAVGAGAAAVSPIAFWVMERVSPSHVGRGGFAPVMRLATAIGLIGGLHLFYQRSARMLIRPCNAQIELLIRSQNVFTDSPRMPAR